MKTTHHALVFRYLPADFAGLVGVYVPKPIRDDAELDRAMEIIDALAGQKLTKDQDAYLDLVSELVEKYDAERAGRKLSKMSPRVALRYILKQAGLTPSDLGKLLGDRSLGIKILEGQREMSKAHIRKLAQTFKVSPALFI